MKTIREKYAAARQAAQEIHDRATGEGRAKTEEEQVEFDRLTAEAKQHKATLDQIAADDEAMGDLADVVGADDDAVDHPTGKTPGERFINSSEFKAMKAGYAGGPPAGTRIQMAGSVSVGSFRNAVTVGTSTTAPLHRIAPAELSVIDIFDVINVIEDAPDTIKVFRTAFTNNADVQTVGEPKEESDLTITPVTVTLDTIAHHTPVNNQTLWHNSLLRNRIDVHMINGVRAKAQAEVAAALEAEIGGGFIQQQGFDTDIATTLRKAVTKAMRGAMEIGGSNTLQVVLSPEDHEALDLELLDAMIALAGQELAQTSRIWRSQVVPLYGLNQGVAFVGDMRQVDFYVGTQGITVTTGWVDDQFIRNQQTILAEMEAATAVLGAAAICAADLASGTAPDFS
jgi:hypothetical protein